MPVIYVAAVTVLTTLWSLHQIQSQLRMQPEAGQCGGVLAPAEGVPQGDAERCELIPWRVPVLIATGFVLVVPAFLPPAALFVPPSRVLTRGVGRLRASLFLLLVLEFSWLTMGIVIGIENNSQSEYCDYQQMGFAPWSNQGFPCWPEWGYLALHWVVFTGFLCLILGVPMLAIARGVHWWRRRRSAAPPAQQ